MGAGAQFAVSLLALFAGGAVMGGYFAAAQNRSGAPEKLYAADLLGAAAGAFAVSGALVPIFGLRTALLAVTAALLPCFFLVRIQKTAPAPRA